MAVTSGGITSRARSAINSSPSGRHAVCLESMNHELVRPDFNVKSPRRTEWVRRWSMNCCLAPGALTPPTLQDPLLTPSPPVLADVAHRRRCATSARTKEEREEEARKAACLG